MGLDIYFEKRKKENAQLGYFRKVNCLVAWVGKNIGEVENCKDIVLQKEDLEKLLNDIVSVLDNHLLAKELLPTLEGFFFGGSEYDDYYFEHLQEVKEALEKTLQSVVFDREEVTFYCSW